MEAEEHAYDKNLELQKLLKARERLAEICQRYLMEYKTYPGGEMSGAMSQVDVPGDDRVPGENADGKSEGGAACRYSNIAIEPPRESMRNLIPPDFDRFLLNNLLLEECNLSIDSCKAELFALEARTLRVLDLACQKTKQPVKSDETCLQCDELVQCPASVRKADAVTHRQFELYTNQLAFKVFAVTEIAKLRLELAKLRQERSKAKSDEFENFKDHPTAAAAEIRPDDKQSSCLKIGDESAAGHMELSALHTISRKQYATSSVLVEKLLAKEATLEERPQMAVSDGVPSLQQSLLYNASNGTKSLGIKTPVQTEDIDCQKKEAVEEAVIKQSKRAPYSSQLSLNSAADGPLSTSVDDADDGPIPPTVIAGKQLSLKRPSSWTNVPASTLTLRRQARGRSLRWLHCNYRYDIQAPIDAAKLQLPIQAQEELRSEIKI